MAAPQLGQHKTGRFAQGLAVRQVFSHAFIQRGRCLKTDDFKIRWIPHSEADILLCQLAGEFLTETAYSMLAGEKFLR